MKHTVIVFFKGIQPIYGSVRRFDCYRGPETDHNTNQLKVYESLGQTQRVDLKDIAHYQVIPIGGE